MKVYRIVAAQYAESLMASGRSARWNSADQFVIYTSASRSLATLELLVNLSGTQLNRAFKVLEIEFPEDFISVDTSTLGNNWRLLNGYPFTQQIGARWYINQESLALSVPSAVIPEERNFILNTRHPQFKETKILSTGDYFWDKRLL